MNKKKHKPRPITSFMEDELELDDLKKSMQKEIKRQKRTETEARNKHYAVVVVRVVIALIAFVLAIWLYIMVDDFISHHQHQRLRSVNTAFLLIK